MFRVTIYIRSQHVSIIWLSGSFSFYLFLSRCLSVIYLCIRIIYVCLRLFSSSLIEMSVESANKLTVLYIKKKRKTTAMKMDWYFSFSHKTHISRHFVCLLFLLMNWRHFCGDFFFYQNSSTDVNEMCMGRVKIYRSYSLLVINSACSIAL